MNEQLREIGRDAELAAAKEAGRREVWRLLLDFEPWELLDGHAEESCFFCMTDYGQAHSDGCLYRRAVEAMSEPEGR